MERFTSGALQHVLEKVAPAVAAGGANIISVEAIRERSEGKWERKREQVADFVGRAFSRLSQPGDFITALNDSEFLTIQPSVVRSAALSVSAIILKETLAFFLGNAMAEDLRLFQVLDFTDSQLNVQPLDAANILAGGEPEPWLGRTSGDDPAASGTGALLASLEDQYRTDLHRIRLSSPPNIELDLVIQPEATWNILAKVVASFVLRPSMWLTVGDEPERRASCGELTAALAAEVAIGALNWAEDLIARSDSKVALHVPLPWNALTYSTSRNRLLLALRNVSPALRRFLILEITELSDGLPPSRLSEQVSMVAPYGRTVLARAPSLLSDVRVWRGCGLSGVTLDCQDLDASDRRGQKKLEVFARRAAEASLACVGYGLPATTLMLAAWASGFTHLGGPAVTGEVAEPKGVVRLRPADVFAARSARLS